MKTPEQWETEWFYSEQPTRTSHFELIKAIQQDALSDPLACTTDQQELDMANERAANERIRADQLHDEMLRMRAKWHEARRYLRAANRGAERNNFIMRLQAQTIKQLIHEAKTNQP